MNGKCTGCGQTLNLRVQDGKYTAAPCGCRTGAGVPAVRPLTKGGGGVPRGDETPAPHKWSNAKKTVCMSKHTHDSKMEARVCDRLTSECYGTPRQVLQQVRLPLLCLPKENGKPNYISIDFAIYDRGHSELIRLVDAKNKKRVSRDWPARKRAAELSWGIRIEEVDR